MASTQEAGNTIINSIYFVWDLINEDTGQVINIGD
jgi:hypothetical protein